MKANRTSIYRALLAGMLSCVLHGGLYAQDQIYSQFFNAPMYLNPALTGQFEGDLRFQMLYRNHWTSVPGNLSYYTFSADWYTSTLSSGLGIMINHSDEGTSFMKKTSAAFNYAYLIEMETGSLSFGVQAGVVNSRIDFGDLVFPDQLDPYLGIIPGTSGGVSALLFDSKYYFDAGVGANLVLGNFMGGVAATHLNSPDESFTGNRSRLPVRYNAHLSYRFPVGRYYERAYNAIIPSVVYYQQGGQQALSAGAQYKYRGMNVGLWYRTAGLYQNFTGDAIVVSLIFDLFTNKDKLRLGVSHDATMSRVGYGNTSGSSEGALSYEISYPSSTRSPGFNNLKCYDFY